jgi:hypothetical protein
MTLARATLVCLSVLLVTSPARAQATIDECIDRIETVQLDLDSIYASGGIGGRNAERTYLSLTSKLQGAIVKLVDGKVPDAERKLMQFAEKVADLAGTAKPKLDQVDAELLLYGFGISPDEGVLGAVVCVQSL